MADFLMPSLGADMEFGALLEWRVKPGDAVKRGDIVAVVDTSKAEIEVEIFEDGVIDELLVAEGTKHVPVGTVLARVRSDAGEQDHAAQDAAPATAASPPVAATAPAATTAPAPAAAPTPPAPHGQRVRVSPVARRAAERLGVDLSTVPGSGPDGAITKADVERAAAQAEAEPGAPAPSPSPVAETPAPALDAQPQTAEPAARQAAMRQAIGALMARSKREIPHYYLQTQIDLGRTMSWLAEENASRPVPRRLLSSVVLIGAVARAAAEMPAMNGFWVDGELRSAERVHVGVAISLRGGGVIAPAVHDADGKSLDELMDAVRDLVQRARTGRLRSSQMSDPTITVTNLGEQGVDLVHGVIYPPQVALVGFGGVRERPWAQDGMLGARPVVHATLAADHRASDGHAGSRFLQRIAQLLQSPEEL